MQEKSDTPSVKGKNYADFSRDELIAEINRLKKTKKYGLVWEHKKEEVIENFKAGQQPYLEEVEDKRIENAPGQPTNLIIEGDNFDALSVLNYTHAGKIDVIYIDPPYNTGNKDFIYNDNYVDSEDSFRHSKWLSFMEPRLKLAKNLLSEDGVIFISIDDNELFQLKMLCDTEIGSENFIGCLPRVTKKSGKQHSNNVASNHDYILIYASSAFSSAFCGIRMKDDSYPYRDDHYDERGGYQLNQTLDYSSLFYNEAMDYEININGEVFYAGNNREKWLERHAGNHKNTDWVWRWGKQKLQFGLDNDFVVIKKSKNGKRIYTKTYAKAAIGKNNGDYYIEYLDRANNLSSLALTENIFSNDNAKKEFQKITTNGGFDFPKPTALVRQLLEIIKNKDATILDFFAGSGTTGHAVLELNKEDGGHRQFILCTNNGDKGPDSTKIAEDITYPRIKTVITGKRQDGSKYSDGIPANLRYYKIRHGQKLDSNDANRLEMSKHMEDILQIKENAFEEVKSSKIYKLYKNSEKYLCLALDAFEMEKIVEKIAEENKKKLDTVIYSFSYSRDAFEDDYETDFNIEFKAMPEGLLKTYLNITESLRSEE